MADNFFITNDNTGIIIMKGCFGITLNEAFNIGESGELNIIEIDIYINLEA